MKIGKLRTLWIILLSVLATADTCGRAVVKSAIGQSNRKWVDKTIHKWVNRLLSLIRVQCTIINPHQVKPVPGKPTIIMSNHSSLYDIPLSFKAFPEASIRMLAKKELAHIPIMGRGMTAAEFPFVDRKNRLQAVKDLEAVRKLLESGIVMWVAPEGTRSKDGTLGAFKKGAFITAIEAKATIIPIAIRGAYDILPARTTQLHLNQKAEVRVGDPIDAGMYSFENRNELVARVRDSIKGLLEEE